MSDVRISQADKASQFLALHAPGKPFVLGNPWDVGSARILAATGYEAIATSSSAFAGTLGRRDGGVTRDEALAHARDVVEAVDIPVSADLENCFGHDPAFVAETITMAAGTGLAGCSVEDATGDRDKPLYDYDDAVARVAAAAKAAKSLDHPFVLTARTESFLRGFDDLADVIKRLQGFEAAGADVLMAPGLPSLEAVQEVCAAVSKPVNFMVGIPGRSWDRVALAGAGVARISLATSLYRAAMDGLISAAAEALEEGTFSFVESAVSTRDLAGYMK
jgi:2-methylisocitrate lyase-like PEP mutase family enzyme